MFLFQEMTRERASKRTPEEWASQHKAAEQARRRSVEKHALRRLAYKDPEPEIIKPLVEVRLLCVYPDRTSVPNTVCGGRGGSWAVNFLWEFGVSIGREITGSKSSSFREFPKRSPGVFWR